MANFNIAYKITMGHEGGYANDPKDLGGETIFGITRRDWPHSPIWAKVDSYKKNLGLEKAIPIMNADANIMDIAKSIYKKNYWDVNGLDKVTNQEVANELFDTGVNMGTGVAARFLQRALNMTNRNQIVYPDLSVDGRIGSKTLQTVNTHPNLRLLNKILNALQGARYIEIMESAPAQERFATSWFSRVTI